MLVRTTRPDLARDGGFTLVEALVTVVILVALAAISVPIYMGQTAKGHRSVAQQDGSAWSSEIASMTSGITQFGSTGTTTITLGAVTNGQATLTVNNGTGYKPSTEDPAPHVKVNVSNGTTLTSGSVVPGGTGWCMILSNDGERVGFNQSGYQDLNTACTNGVLS